MCGSKNKYRYKLIPIVGTTWINDNIGVKNPSVFFFHIYNNIINIEISDDIVNERMIFTKNNKIILKLSINTIFVPSSNISSVGKT